MTSKKFALHVYQRHGLTPLQALVLSAFDDGRAHDRVTIATFMDGNHHGLSRYPAVKTVADGALSQLVAIGLVVRDSSGWHQLAAQDAPQRAQEGIDES